MGFNEFWLQSNKGKHISADDMQSILKSDMGKSKGLKQIFNIFDSDPNGIIEGSELESLFTKMVDFAGSNGNMILEEEEAEAFLENEKDDKGESLKDKGVTVKDVFDFLGKITNAVSKKVTPSTQDIGTTVEIPTQTTPQNKSDARAKIDNILKNPKYTRTIETNTIISVCDETGKRVAIIYPRIERVEIYDQPFDSPSEIHKSTGVAYSYSGEHLYNFEHDYDAMKEGERYPRITEYHDDGTMLEIEPNGHSKTYKITTDPATYKKVRGQLLSESYREVDAYGNTVKTTEIDYQKNTTTILDRDWNGYEYNNEDKSVVREIVTQWDDEITARYQYQNYVTDGGMRTYEILHYGQDKVQAEELSASERRELRQFAVNQIMEDVEGAISALDAVGNNLGVFQRMVNSPVMIMDALIDSWAGTNLFQDIHETQRKMKDFQSKIRNLPTTASNFEEEFYNTLGTEYKPEKIKELKMVTGQLEQNLALRAISSAIDGLLKYGTKGMTEPQKWNVYKNLFGQIIGKDAANFKVDMAVKMFGEKYAEKQLKEELKKYQSDFQKQIRKGLSAEGLQKRYKALYEECFGESNTEWTDDYLAMLNGCAMVWEVASVFVGAGEFSASAGFVETSAALSTKFGGKILSKAAATVIGASIPAVAESVGHVFTDNGREQLAQGDIAGAFASETASEKFYTNLMYGAFGAFASGPTGETVSKLIQIVSKSPSKIATVMSNIVGVGTETTLDVVFDRLTSDLSLTESLGQNGVMNFAMMFMGGRINHRVSSNDLAKARKNARDVKVQRKEDGTYVLKDGKKTVEFKTERELCEFLLLGKKMTEVGRHASRAAEKSSMENPTQIDEVVVVAQRPQGASDPKVKEDVTIKEDTTPKEAEHTKKPSYEAPETRLNNMTTSEALAASSERVRTKTTEVDNKIKTSNLTSNEKSLWEKCKQEIEDIKNGNSRFEIVDKVQILYLKLDHLISRVAGDLKQRLIELKEDLTIYLEKKGFIEKLPYLDRLKENGFKDVKILENLTEAERASLVESMHAGDIHTLMLFANGGKPACYLTTSQARHDAIAKMKNDDIDIVQADIKDYNGCPVTENYLLNKKDVQEIIKNNKELYAVRLGIDKNSSVDEIYKKLISQDSPLSQSGRCDDILGLTLGYPRYSTMIYQLKEYANIEPEEFKTNLEETKEKLKQALYAEDSPYKNMSDKFKQKLAAQIDKIDGYNFSNKTLSVKNFEDPRAIYPFATFLNEPAEIARIQKGIDHFEETMDRHRKINYEQPRATRSQIADATSDIISHYSARKSDIDTYMHEAGLDQLGEFSSRVKSRSSLNDKITNYASDNLSAPIEECIGDVRDAYGGRTLIDSINLKEHPEVKALLDAGKEKEAILRAAEIQSAPTLEKLKGMIVRMGNGTADLHIDRISNYVSKDGVPYFSEKQLAELKQCATRNGVELQITTKLEADDVKAGQVDFNYKPTTKNQPSGYTALQINFRTKQGETLEWQCRGKLVGAFAEGEHIPYDLRTGKNIVGDHPELKGLYEPIEALLDPQVMPKEEFSQYNKYLNAYYEYLRKTELGFKAEEPKLSNFGDFDVRLEAQNLVHLHEVADKLKKGEITRRQAMAEYERRISGKVENPILKHLDYKKNTNSEVSIQDKVDNIQTTDDIAVFIQENGKLKPELLDNIKNVLKD